MASNPITTRVYIPAPVMVPIQASDKADDHLIASRKQVVEPVKRGPEPQESVVEALSYMRGSTWRPGMQYDPEFARDLVAEPFSRPAWAKFQYPDEKFGKLMNVSNVEVPRSGIRVVLK